MIDVDKDDAERFGEIRLNTLCVQFPDTGFQLAAVGDTGQRVLTGRLAQFPIEQGVLFRVRFISEDFRDSLQVPIPVQHGDRVQLEFHPLVVLQRDPDRRALRLA